jgi:hypothetical protein
MDLAPLARIAVRYLVGAIIGTAGADAIVNDADLMHYITIGLSALVGVATEYVYALARKRGWAT